MNQFDAFPFQIIVAVEIGQRKHPQCVINIVKYDFTENSLELFFQPIDVVFMGRMQREAVLREFTRRVRGLHQSNIWV